MSSAKAHLASRVSKIADLTKHVEFKQVPTVDAKHDFVSQYVEASGAKKDFSNVFVVNVLPDFIPITMYIMYHVNATCHKLEASFHAKISPGTYAAYCLSLVYGFFLACDVHIRPTPSAHAAAYDETAYKKKFLDFLLGLPVPTFLEPVLAQFAPTTDELRGNILFVPSAAGFDYGHHFGRFFPISVFTSLHDTTAEMPSNSSRFAIYTDLFTRVLYTIHNPQHGQAQFDASVANFVGVNFAAAAATYNDSRLFQTFQSFFNPVLFRDAHRRQTLASVSITPLEFTGRSFNFYDLVFSANSGNLNELRVVFNSIAASLNGSVPCKFDLAQIISSSSGSSILSHGYSIPSLPLCHHTPILNDGTIMTALRARTPAQIAQSINYLQTPNPQVNNVPAQPTAVCNVEANHATTVTFNSVFNRLAPTDANVNVPSFANDFEIFNEDRHVTPRVYVLNPTDPTTIDAWKVTCFGMVIESFDIDGTVSAVPNVHLGIGIENSWFADSAIPIRYTFRQIAFLHGNQTNPARARTRVIAPRQTRMPAAALLVDRTRVNLPQAAAHTVGNLTDANAFAGLFPVPHVTWLQMLQSFLGFRTSDPRSHDLASDTIPGMTEGRLIAWSPYTYVGFEPESDIKPDFDVAHIYFLMNPRTIYGTRIPLVEVNHFLEAMPAF
jgi:hypothetical protein